jgi:phospholipid/cholesterol/gamma-HCH transport system permease protein
VRAVLDQARSALSVFTRTLYYVLRVRWRWPSIFKEMFEAGNRSLLFVLLTLGFLGAILNLQTGFQAKRVLGDASLVGAQTLPLLLRLFGPTLTGLMVATRVGTGIAAEVGSMVVTEQVDALRMNNAPPVDYLIKPRFLACLVMLPALTLFGIASAFVAGMAVSYGVFQVNPATYANFDLIGRYDLVEGMVKAVAYGAAIPTISGAAGLDARGGSEGVGEATTRAVVNSSLAVIVLDFVIGGAFFLGRG